MTQLKPTWSELTALNPELQARLFERFPRLYQHPDLLEFSVPAGWFELIWRLSTQLEPFDLRVRQVKTKFGSLRFYCQPYNPKAQVFITAAQTESAILCEACGKSGTLGARAQTEWAIACEEHRR